MTAKLIKDVHVRCAQCGAVFHPLLPRLPRTTGQWDKFIECGHTTQCPRCRAIQSCDRSNLAYTLVAGRAQRRISASGRLRSFTTGCRRPATERCGSFSGSSNEGSQSR